MLLGTLSSYHSLNYHLYANENQFFTCFKSCLSTPSLQLLSFVLCDEQAWITFNELLLNSPNVKIYAKYDLKCIDFNPPLPWYATPRFHNSQELPLLGAPPTSCYLINILFINPTCS